jgi:cytosine/adenosine deaminase-related metal-dependent hydrolase
LNAQQQNQLIIRGARCALGPEEATHASVEITGDRITRILSSPNGWSGAKSGCTQIDLAGFLLLPGFVNAHDHLEFALFPRLGNPPYRNYIDWGDDIHRRFPDIIAKHRAVPKEIRLWWGGLRNLLCGVTTVSHHNPLWPELQREDFPVRVVQEYGWGHSLALGGDLRQAHAATPAGRPFIVHACEGVDAQVRQELWGLDRLGVLDNSTVLVHGLAIDRDGVALMRDRKASLIVCPSSNNFLFKQLPDISLFSKIEKIALGSDSPLTAEGDLLDEIRFAIRFCGISATAAHHMVTTASAAILRLGNAEGSIRESGMADLIAIRDTGQHSADRLQTLSMNDVQLVMIGGRVQLAAEAMLERLPSAVQRGLEPLSIDGSIRWLRAPVKALLQKTEEVLGSGEVRLGHRKLLIPAGMVAEYVN